jgi:hypothetical protein
MSADGLDLTPNRVDSVLDTRGQTRNGGPEFRVSATEALGSVTRRQAVINL